MTSPKKAAAAPAHEPELKALYAHPGFLMRRAHQIAESSFLRECDGAITPPQFSALTLVAIAPGIDAMGVSRVIGLDRTTSALVVNNLVKSGWVSRHADPLDGRRWHLQITTEGQAMIERIRPAAERSENHLLSAFGPKDQALLVKLLERFVTSFNSDSAAPVDAAALPRARSRMQQQRG